ncbi:MULTISPECIES: HAD family phosphatase [unclassified Streptomyces]|uniref:HAD family hydrolase n=1 Tax=unclassified Streptomyces TaxID=2593676 RepID=UPI0022521A0D|nr:MULTISPECIES: HAD-IB family phosphatase [unclassified Streptomyces]MCX5438386.1 HAD-IB family phosphatase [Streptomyces sp. NBC_00063]WSE16022.1 HAD-IB family phosphatase [Streptomyces sp. NBC_01397]WUB95065.1 HAD-IB family phosphatase [Streptomyces sp. NBC_00569]
MARLHLFDLDGTLLHGTSAPVEISRQLGLEAETVALDREIGAQRIGPPEYARRVHALWERLTPEHVTAAFEGAPWLTGIRETWAEIRARGEYCAVVSLSPSFFVERLTGWGAHAAYGSRFPAVPFTEPVDPSGVLSAAAKVKIADRLCEQFGVSRADCLAYGDSLSDVELFGAVPVSIAINADQHVAALATHSYVGRDLWEAYELVRHAR